MQFDIQDLGPVRKKVRIEIPAKRVDSTFASVYNQLAQKASLPGFRKGKVPISHVRKMYADQARYSVTEKLVDAGWKQLLDEHEVVPISEPELDAVEPVIAGKEYAFTMSFDVAPEFDLKPFSELSIEKENWVASATVVEHELIHLAEHVSEYEDVSDRTAAQMDDQAIIDYAGSIDGETFAGGTASDAALVLGSDQFIPGFEEQIVGQEVGSAFEVNVAFPEDYQAENLKGKDAVFACTLKAIKAKKCLEIGPELAEKMGESDIDSLKARMKTEVETKYNSRAQSEARDVIRTELGNQYDFEVPPTLLKSSLEDHRKSLVQAAIREGKSADEAQTEVNSTIGDEEVNVIRDIRAYLVIDTVARQEKIEVTEENMRDELQNIMSTMGPYAQQVLEMYRTPERRAELMRKIRHDKVLDFLLVQANVTSVEREVPAHDCEH
jgi:trigger factor